MALDITPEEATRAQLLVHKVMLEQLWCTALGSFNEPQEEAAACASGVLVELERLLAAVRGRDADVTQHVAITIMEDMWRAMDQ